MPEWILVIFRTLLFIALLFLLTKLLGKKQISQLSYFEYISGITLGSIAAELITGLDRNIYHGLIAIVIFGAITYLVDWFSLKSNTFRDITEGKATEFIKDGKVLEDNLKKEHYSIEELMSLLRKKDVFNVADVEFALLEPTGDLSVLLKKEKQPVTPLDLGMKVANEKMSQIVIMDGLIINDNLAAANKSREWLNAELAKLNATVDNVFIGSVDSYGQLTIDFYDDQLQNPASQERPLLLATIKKCQADLESFALETETDEAKQIYTKNAKKVAETIELLTPYLRG